MTRFDQQVAGWLEQGQQVAVATVVGARQPSPRDVGARMAFSSHGQIAGSVTWGCVENAVLEQSRLTLEHGGLQMLHFGTVTDTTFEIGLTCGGDMDICVERLDPAAWLRQQDLLEQQLVAGRSCALAVVVESAGPAGARLLLNSSGILDGTTGQPDLDQQITAACQDRLEQGESGLVDTAGSRVFVDVHRPPPRLVIIGAGHVSIPLVTFGETLGFRTFVIDPRSSLLTEDRFAHASYTFPEWPTTALQRIPLDGDTFLVLLTHDPKLDDPVFELAAAHHPAYIGALGSRRTHEKRLARLREAGLEEEQLQKIHAPVGLDLGGREPEEIALSIMAEIVQVRRAAEHRT